MDASEAYKELWDWASAVKQHIDAIEFGKKMTINMSHYSILNSLLDEESEERLPAPADLDDKEHFLEHFLREEIHCLKMVNKKLQADLDEGWVSVADRLPEDTSAVLTHPMGVRAMYCAEHWWNLEVGAEFPMVDEPTLWCPLPPGPKEA